MDHNYDDPNFVLKENEKSMSQFTPPLQIEKLIVDMVPNPPKGTIRRDAHNPNYWDAQIYNIIEYLSQYPCAI